MTAGEQTISFTREFEAPADHLLKGAYGRDKGADIPTRTDYVRALKPLLDRFGNERDLTIILFTLDETAYSRELAPLAQHFLRAHAGRRRARAGSVFIRLAAAAPDRSRLHPDECRLDGPPAHRDDTRGRRGASHPLLPSRS